MNCGMRKMPMKSKRAPKLGFAMAGAVPGGGTAPSQPITLYHGLRRMPKRKK